MINNLHLLPTGEGTIVKRTKHGFWVLIDGYKIFIHYSETLNESIFDTVKEDDNA